MSARLPPLPAGGERAGERGSRWDGAKPGYDSPSPNPLPASGERA